MQFTVSLGKESLSDLFRFFEIVTESDFSDDIQRQSLCHERDVHLYILLAKPLSHAFGSKAKVVLVALSWHSASLVNENGRKSLEYRGTMKRRLAHSSVFTIVFPLGTEDSLPICCKFINILNTHLFLQATDART